MKQSATKRAVITLMAALPLVAMLPTSSWAQDIAVVGFTLIDATLDQELTPMEDGMVIPLADLTGPISIRADVEGAVGSVSFDLVGPENHTQTESVAPYALYGDTSGDYNPWDPIPGDYVLTATPYTAAGGGGDAGTIAQVTFTIEGANTAAQDPASVPDRFAIDGIYPNPFNPAATVSFVATEPGAYVVQVIDMLGQVRHEQQAAVHAPGRADVSLSFVDFPSGAYLISIQQAATGRRIYGTGILAK